MNREQQDLGVYNVASRSKHLQKNISNCGAVVWDTASMLTMAMCTCLRRPFPTYSVLGGFSDSSSPSSTSSAKREVTKEEQLEAALRLAEKKKVG
jgi:NAD/NADP transhydrogenase beta subunit